MRLKFFSLFFASLVLVGCGSSDDLAAFVADTTTGGNKTVLTRRRVSELSPAQKSAFVAAVKAMKTTESAYEPGINAYDYFVKLHTAAFEQMASNAHMNPNFLPWHREMLRRFEGELQRVSGDATMTLPYWDWTRSGSFEAVFSDDFLGGDGDPDQNFAVTSGPFRAGEWEVLLLDATDDEHDGDIDLSIQAGPLQRNFGDPQGLFPTQEEVDDAIETFRAYDSPPFNRGSNIDTSFRNYIEGWWPTGSSMHNGVHVFVGGQMQTASSPNDPVFFLHHAQVDRLWYLYQKAWGNSSFPLDYIDDPLFEFDGVQAGRTFNIELHSGVRYSE
jgi:tyrosinase